MQDPVPDTSSAPASNGVGENADETAIETTASTTETDTGSSDSSTGPTDSAIEPAEAPEPSSGANIPGRHDHVVEVDGLERDFIVYVPEAAVGHAAPVVFMLHGTSGDGERFFNLSGWVEKADEEGIIAVFPSSLTYCFYEDDNGDGDYDDRGERRVTTKWAHGKLGDELPLCSEEEVRSLAPGRRALADHPLMDDLKFFDVMIDVLEVDYVIDSSRIYASGFSNGAGMSSYLAAHRSDRFAAVHAAAGLLDDDVDWVADRAISVVLSIGEVDGKFTSTAIPMDEGLPARFPMSGVVDRYLSLLQLGEAYDYELMGPTGQQIASFLFEDAADGVDNSFRLVILEGLAHQYPNGSNYPLRIADPVWEFFSQHSL